MININPTKGPKAVSGNAAHESRIRRGGSGPVDTGRQSVSERVVARQTPEAMVQPVGMELAMNGLAQSITSYFGGVDERDQREELARETERNETALREAQAKVWMNRDKAREAIETGDYSFFIPEDEIRARKIVQQKFAQMAGTEAALEDFEEMGVDSIRRTPLDGDPRATIEKTMRDQLIGADPHYSQAYANAYIQKSEPYIGEWQKSRHSAMVAEAEATATNTAVKAISAGDIKTLDQVMEMRMRISGSLMGPSPLNEAKSRGIVEEALLDAAAQGNKAAWDLIGQPNPLHDGRSILETKKLEYGDLEARYRANRAKAQVKPFYDGLSDLTRKMDEGMPPAMAAVELGRIRQAHGNEYANDNASFRVLYKRIQSATKAVTSDMAALDHVWLKKPPVQDADKTNKRIVELALTGQLERALIESKKMTPEMARGRVMDYLAQIEDWPPEAQKILAQHSRWNDRETRNNAFRLLKGIEAAGRHPRAALPDGSSGAIAYHLYRRLSANPDNADNIIQKMEEARAKHGDKLNPETYLNEIRQGNHKPWSPTKQHEMLQTAVNKGFFNGVRSMSELSSAAQVELLKELNVWAYVNSDQPFDESTATEALAAIGDEILTKRKRGNDWVFDIKTHADRNNPSTPEMQDQLTETLLKAAPDLDAVVSHRNGQHVLQNASGQDYRFRPGSRARVNREDLPPGADQMFDITSTDDPNIVVVEVPGVPGENYATRLVGHVADDGTAFQLDYDVDSGTWHITVDPPPESTTPEEVQKAGQAGADLSKERRNMMVEHARIFSMTGGQEARNRAMLEWEQKWGRKTPAIGYWGKRNPRPTDLDAQKQTEGEAVDTLFEEIVTEVHSRGIAGVGTTKDAARAAKAEMLGAAKNAQGPTPVTAEEGAIVKAKTDPETASVFSSLVKAMSNVSLISSAQAGELQKAVQNNPSMTDDDKQVASVVTKLVPENLSFLVDYLLGSTAYGEGTATEAHLSTAVRASLLQAMESASKAGRSVVDYKDYPKFSNGMTAAQLVGDPKARAKRYTKDWTGFMNLLKDSRDPAFVAATTLGGFSFTKQEDGTYSVKDRYDFSNTKHKTGDVYGVIRNMFGVSDKGFDVRLTLTEADKVVPKQPDVLLMTHTDIANLDPQEFISKLMRNLRGETAEVHGASLDAADLPPGEGFEARMGDFISKNEGYKNFVYDDSNGRPWTQSKSKKRGTPTVGYGFSLGRKDAREKLKQVGGDYDSLMQNKTSLSQQQSQRLLEIVMRENLAKFKKEIGKEATKNLYDNELIALASIMYQSPYGEFSVRNKDLIAAIKKGDKRRAGEIIETLVNRDWLSRNGKGHLIPGIERRRKDERMMWDGMINEF